MSIIDSFFFNASTVSLFALEDDLPISASQANERQIYLCTGCKGKVRVRRGRFRVAHFYHLTRSPTCRLYSKSEDHLLAQLALQKLLPPKETVLEKPFIEILRVADLIWEPPKLAFEVQCSLLSVLEAERRMDDYRQQGYQVVWILDDRLFNRRSLRPAEDLIRKTPCYFANLPRGRPPAFYDQFEVFCKTARIKKGGRLLVHLDRPRLLMKRAWAPHSFPKQILSKIETNNLYFHGDLLHKAVLSASIPKLACTMQNLRALEIIYLQRAKIEENPLRKLKMYLMSPFWLFVRWLLEKINNDSKWRGEY